MRANNEGSIYPRKDGRWVASVTALKDGQRKRVSRYAETEEEARRILTDLKHRQDGHLPVQFDRQTVGEWLEYWLNAFIRPPRRKPKTWASYDSTIRNYVLPAIGNEPLMVAPELIQELLNFHHDRGCQRTAEYIRTILRTAFQRAVKLKRMPWNPIDSLDSVTVNRHESEVFTAEEAERLLQAAAGHRREGVFWLALSLGLRKGELMGAELQDLDLQAGVIEIRKNLQRIKLPNEKKSQLVEGTPKSKASRRRLPLPLCALQALEHHLKLRDDEKLLAGSAWRESHRLFTTLVGTALDGDNVARTFHALCRKAEVPLIRFHDLRHSCGTFLHAQGVSPFTIQEILGHSQLATTRRYTHVDEAIQKDALGKVSDLLQQKKRKEPAAETPPAKTRLMRVK